MLLSIVIPIYNVEKFVYKCLESVFNQNISDKDYEVIVVNDGTKDNSMSIVREFQKCHSNMIIINQENQGLSVARNQGLFIAKGQYIWFVDSDDFIEANCLKGIKSSLSNDIDLLQIQYRLVYDDSSKNRNVKFCEINNITSGLLQTLRGGVPVPVPFTIYRREFLLRNQLSFYPGIYHEDSEFKPKALYIAQKIMSYNYVVYNYYQRNDGNIMSKFRYKNGIDILFVNNRLIDFAVKNKIKKPYLDAFYNNIGLNINVLLSGLWQLGKSEQINLKQKLIDNRKQFTKMLVSSNLKYKIEALLFCINVRLALFLYKIFPRI